MTVNSKILLAKSRSNGGTTLVNHTMHVIQAIEHLANKFSFIEPHIAAMAAALHDTGKAHPKFQNQLLESDGFKPKSLFEKRQWAFTHRHELSSLLLLPCFPRQYWDVLIEMIVSHHKSIEEDNSGRGLIDLLNADGSDVVFENHSKNGKEWFPLAIEILRELGFTANDVDYASAMNAWEYTIEYCIEQLKKRDWSPRRGLLMAADHFASAMGHRTAEEIKQTFQIPDVSTFEPVEPGGVLFPLTDVSVKDPRKHTLLVAPTGAGKTDFLMRRCAGKRIFYTLPFQASINAMWLRFKEKMPDNKVYLQHAAAPLFLKQEAPDAFEEEYPLHGLVGSAVKILTPHQLATVVLGLPGFESVMLDLRETAVILDEIHTYSDVSRSLVIEIVKVLLKLDCAIHIGTATMPTPMYKELLSLLGGDEQVYQVKLSRDHLKTYDRHKVYKMQNWQEANAVLSEAMKAGEKVLIVCNTVKKAQEIFTQLCQQHSDHPHMLIHSRFRRKDRAMKEKALREDFEGSNSSGYRPCWVVATQVVEVSLDISFDRMITACAPLDALIQRFGRVNRRRTIKALGTQKSVHVVVPEGDERPYDSTVVNKTFTLLPCNGETLQEETLQNLLDAVYPILPEVVDITEHLIWRNDQFRLPPLCNRKSSVIQEILEISSASCVLECDRELYENSTWYIRAGLEIPVSRNAIVRTALTYAYVQLEKGSRPFIVPQAEAEHAKMGLILHAHDSFL